MDRGQRGKQSAHGVPGLYLHGAPGGAGHDQQSCPYRRSRRRAGRVLGHDRARCDGGAAAGDRPELPAHHEHDAGCLLSDRRPGHTRYVCPAVKNVLGYSAEEIMGRPAADFYPDQCEREALVAAVRGNGFVHDFPGRMKRKDGRIIDISISTNALRDEQGQYAGVEGIWRDITQRKEMERELERLATRDDLTGLANRRHILDALERAFKRREGRHDAMPFCALIMDLDHFKRINDTYGHVAGDAVLRGVARIVEALSRAGDQIGRLGGEEFLLLLEGADLAAAVEAAERIRSAVQAASIEVAPGLQVSQTLSIGISCWMHADGQSTDMLERADRALYHAKAQGRNMVCNG